jgi:hypothetical protein
MKTLTIRARAHEANKVIGIVSGTGRRFLYSECHDRVARVGLDGVLQVWWIDHHTGMRLYPFGGGHWFGFSGAPLELELFTDDATQWDYGAAMAEVRAKVLLTDAVHE